MGYSGNSRCGLFVGIGRQFFVKCGFPYLVGCWRRNDCICRLFQWIRLCGRYTGYLLVAPTVLFLAVWFRWPVLTMVHLSLTAHSVDGVMVEGFTLENYARLFSSDLYFRILMRTIRIALMTSLFVALFAYPLAIAVALGGSTLARLVTITILAPLLVNVVARSYGSGG